MAYQKVGIGSVANDGTGDTLRDGGDKINENFEDLWAKINGVANGDINNGTALTTDAVVLRTGTQTLTNKTLTSPKIADAGFIADANGAEQIIFQTTASAVNEIEITNAATGGDASPSGGGVCTAPIIGSSGETNVDLALLPKGTGIVTIRSTGSLAGQLRLNCEQNSHGQVVVGQPHGSSDSGYFLLPKSSSTNQDGSGGVAGADILLSGDKTVGTTETVSGDGSGTDAVSLDTLVTLLNTSGGTSALTLAAGVAGQVKVIAMHTAGNAATMTVANGNLALGSATTSIVWDAIGESVTLLYTGAKWVVVGQYGVTIT